MSGFSLKVRALVKQRAQGCCEICSKPGSQLHHRRPRQMGGTSDPAVNTASNGLWLCADCHRTVESQRRNAYMHGWLVAGHLKPSKCAVFVGSRWVLLDDDGGSKELASAEAFTVIDSLES